MISVTSRFISFITIETTASGSQASSSFINSFTVILLFPFLNKNQMTATLVRANCKLLSIGNSDSVPLVALLAKNLLIHFFIVMKVNTSSRASYYGIYYTSSSAQYAKVGQSQDVWQVRR